jgi:hypothetical protein
MHILQQLEHEHTARVRSIVDGNVGWTCMQVEALKVHALAQSTKRMILCKQWGVHCLPRWNFQPKSSL